MVRLLFPERKRARSLCMMAENAEGIGIEDRRPALFLQPYATPPSSTHIKRPLEYEEPFPMETRA